MIPPRRKIEYEKVKTDDFVTGHIEDIKYDLAHETNYLGKKKVGPAVRLIFRVDGYQYPHGTPYMSFSLGEKSNLYKKYVSALVQGAEPDMELDIDQLKGMKVKMLWKDDGDFQHIDVIRPAGDKLIPKLGAIQGSDIADVAEDSEDEEALTF